jgi:DNA polymerase-3 subunit delta
VKISGDNLASSLARQLQTIYLVSGDEPLLVNEAADAVRATARQQGFAERELHVVERGFDWHGLLADSRAMSLFAQRKIVEIRMANAAPGEQGADAIVELAERPSADTLILIITGKLDGRTQSSRWVSAVEKRGVLVQVWPIDLPRLPAWIRERLGRHKLQADAAAASLLAERVEGNLLAAHQEVQKLGLLYPPGELSFEQIEAAVLNVARYDVFRLGEAVLAGQAARALRMLEGLEAEGEAAVLVHWTLAEDIRGLKRVKDALGAGKPMPLALREARVWGAKERVFERALTLLSDAALAHLLEAAHICDGLVKGLKHPDWPLDPWQGLKRLVLMLVEETARVGGKPATRLALTA